MCAGGKEEEEEEERKREMSDRLPLGPLKVLELPPQSLNSTGAEESSETTCFRQLEVKEHVTLLPCYLGESAISLAVL